MDLGLVQRWKVDGLEWCSVIDVRQSTGDLWYCHVDYKRSQYSTLVMLPYIIVMIQTETTFYMCKSKKKQRKDTEKLESKTENQKLDSKQLNMLRRYFKKIFLHEFDVRYSVWWVFWYSTFRIVGKFIMDRRTTYEGVAISDGNCFALRLFN